MKTFLRILKFIFVAPRPKYAIKVKGKIKFVDAPNIHIARLIQCKLNGTT
jgi:hypothetical protein